MEIITNMPFAEYKARPGINASLLKTVFGKSLKHAFAELNGASSVDTEATGFGTLFHALALEGREEFAVQPSTYTDDKGEEKKWNGNANVCKAWLAEQKAAGLEPVSQAEADALEQMRDAVEFEVCDLLANSQKEVSLFASRKDGVQVKARIDAIPDDESAPLIDLKTTANAHPQAFVRSCVDLGYIMQAAFYIDVARLCGIERKEVWFVAVETKPPFATTTLRMQDTTGSLLRIGRNRYRAALAKLIDAQATNHWPAYGKQFAEEFAPAWMRQELEATL